MLLCAAVDAVFQGSYALRFGFFTAERIGKVRFTSQEEGCTGQRARLAQRKHRSGLTPVFDWRKVIARARPGCVVSSSHAVGCTRRMGARHARKNNISAAGSAVDSAELPLQTEELAPNPNLRVLVQSVFVPV